MPNTPNRGHKRALHIFILRKEYKIKTILWFFFFLCIVFPHKGYGEDLYSPDIHRILKNGKIIIAMNKVDSPPFFMHDDEGNLIGIDVELSRYLAKHLGVDVVFNREADTFDGVVDIIFNQKADIAVSVLSITLKRCEKVLFTDPYILLHQALLINRLASAQQKIEKNTIKQLNKKQTKIGVIKGTSYVGFAEEDYPLSDIILYDSWNQAVQDVLKGSVLAVLYDDIEIQNWHEKNPDGAIYLQTLVRQDRKDPIAIAVNWKDKQLHAWLNQFLKKIEYDGTKEKLINKYIDAKMALKK